MTPESTTPESATPESTTALSTTALSARPALRPAGRRAAASQEIRADRSPGDRSTAAGCAVEVGEIFARVFRTLEDWRDQVAAAIPDRADLDILVESLVVPALLASAGSSAAGAPPAPESLLIGAGFIAAPRYVNGRDAHFAWWLGPLAANPLLGNSSGPSRLDLATRVHTEYLRDFRELEWYAVPAATNQAHVTGPYVDQLCPCDYIITLTMPVRPSERMIGVVGVDVYVKRLEQVLLPHLLALPGPVVLVNQVGRVVISTEPTLPAGDILPNRRHPADNYDLLPCPGTPFLVATRMSTPGSRLAGRGAG